MKCGKKIDDDSNFCDGCGARVVQFEAEEPVKETPETVAEAVTEAEPEPVTETDPEAEAEVTPEKAPEVVPEAVHETANETVSEASPETKSENLLAKLISLLPKDKKKRTILGGISIVLVLVIIFSSAFGGGGKNEFVVETGIDDIYGGVAFDLEFGDFIERYNERIEADEEYESVAEMQKISYFDFKNNGVTDGIHQYIYSFGYTTGTFPFVQNHELASLSIGVNAETDKIQIVKYVWQADNYNNDNAMQNYYFKLPAKIFSLFLSDIDYPYDGDFSDYQELITKLSKKDLPHEFSGDTMYGLFDTGTDKYLGFQVIALTKDSELYKNSK